MQYWFLIVPSFTSSEHRKSLLPIHLANMEISSTTQLKGRAIRSRIWHTIENGRATTTSMIRIVFSILDKCFSFIILFSFYYSSEAIANSIAMTATIRNGIVTVIIFISLFVLLPWIIFCLTISPILYVFIKKLQGNPPIFSWWEELQQALCLVKHYFQFSHCKDMSFSRKNQNICKKKSLI